MPLGALAPGLQQKSGDGAGGGGRYGQSTLMASWPATWGALGEDCRDPVVLGWHLLEAYRGRLGERLGAVEAALGRGAWAQAGQVLDERELAFDAGEALAKGQGVRGRGIRSRPSGWATPPTWCSRRAKTGSRKG